MVSVQHIWSVGSEILKISEKQKALTHSFSFDAAE